MVVTSQFVAFVLGAIAAWWARGKFDKFKKD